MNPYDRSFARAQRDYDRQTDEPRYQRLRRREDEEPDRDEITMQEQERKDLKCQPEQTTE